MHWYPPRLRASFLCFLHPDKHLARATTTPPHALRYHIEHPMDTGSLDPSYAARNWC